MEKRYWELREECERTFDRQMADKRESNLQAYLEAISTYQDFCMDIFEMLMDENSDVLKNLKIGLDKQPEMCYNKNTLRKGLILNEPY